MSESLEKRTFLDLQKAGLNQFGNLALGWFLTIFIIRLIELIYGSTTQNIGDSLIFLWARGSLYDFIYFSKSIVFLGLIHQALLFISPNIAKIITWVVISVLTLLHLSLMQYFMTSLVPLGADLYSYSLDDIKQTVGAAGVPVLGIIGMIVIVSLQFLLFQTLTKKAPIHRFIIPLVIWALAFVVYYFDAELQIPSHQFSNEFDNYLTYNKSLYFSNSSYDYFVASDDEVDIYADSYLGIGGALLGGNNEILKVNYLDENNYPFLRIDSTQDVLGNFFNKSPQKPNIVFLLVEGLGRAFTGEGAYLGNYTPFIDSLSQKSLYWNNFLSEGGRTFAVLPSILGSLPFGKSGFNDLGNNMPVNNSLIGIMKRAGYHTAFYYGGDSKFDNMKLFLQKEGIDQVNDEPTFTGSGYLKLPKSSSSFTWGYDDKSLFKRYFDVNANETSKPSFQVILTVSTHSPFLINNQSIYTQKLLQYSQSPKARMTPSQQQNAKDYTQMLSTVIYTDEAIREFFEKYKKRKDFANTIFVITGDHRMPEIPMATKIDRFHVPLIIYSPLLKRSVKFESISTHFDIAPTIAAFMNKNYGVAKPLVTNWIGTGIDTVRQFRNVHSYPLMMTKAQMIDFIYGDYVLNGTDLYQIGPNMSMTLSPEKDAQSAVKANFDIFKQKNEKILKGTKLLPDSVRLK
ncbi:LTA synthase family protein [Flectobacillus roseus]|uniref:LTA synthase family protein n=1 Tax=Flectobacillus roseus TaxID=502259 RepID=A0ABT6YE86_9BACT|nr:LTA synthase family protein [Flectobacillus roseus]MDI9861907.1 LTA synthase family protein [Flectobacillus roseus]